MAAPANKDNIDNVNSENNANSVHNTLIDLSNFKPVRLLHNNSKRKAICMQGTFGDSTGAGIVLLEKTAFTDDSLKDNSNYYSSENSLKKVFHNDIYGNYEFFLKPELNAIKTTIIHPATEEHIQKYAIQNVYVVNETPALYESITLPHIGTRLTNLQWVYNILNHTSETERILFEDADEKQGFILLPDLKWDGTLDTLYFLAIVRAHNIKSLRDLSEEHLPLLRNIIDRGSKAIEEKYGLDQSQLRIYLHYQPSFYHLHVHFCYIKYEAPGIFAERAHLLANIISNIELKSDYYQKVTIPFIVRENDELFDLFTAKGILRKRTAV